MEVEMKIQPFRRTILVGVATASMILLLISLVALTRSMRLTVAASGNGGQSTSPSAVSGLLVPQSTAAYNGVITPSQVVFAPWLLGHTSVLRVYNAGDAPAVVQAAFSYTSSLSPITVQPGTVADIGATMVPTGTEFSAILTSTQPIAVAVNDFGPVGQYATSYTAMSASVGRRALALPDIFFEAHGGWESDLALQNVGTATATLTVVYTKTNEPLTTTNWIGEAIPQLGPGDTYFFDPGQAGVPGKFVGVATVRSDQPVIAVVRNAVVNIATFHPNRAYAYRVPLPGPSSGSGRSLYYPLLLNEFEDWKKSEIQVFNAASTGINFTLDIGGVTSSEYIDRWTSQSFPQDAPFSQSPPGEAVAGRVANARSLQSLVWLNGEGRFIGDFLAAYSTPSVGARSWYLPFADQGDALTTFVAIQNLADVATTISLTYHSMTGTVRVVNDTVLGSVTAVYASDAYVPAGFSGGVVVQTDQDVTAVAVLSKRLVLDKEIFLPIALRK
jgi:hypothetical protein